MRFEIGHEVSVVTQKWGGHPHWHYPALYLGSDEHGDWLGFPIGTTYARPGRSFVADFASVGLVPSHDAAHLVAFNRPSDVVTAEIYIDMATPAEWSGDTVRSIDLDLDVVLTRDGRVELLDVDDFEHHQVALGYPPEIIELAESSAARVHAALVARDAPYDGTAEQWFSALAALEG